MPDRSPLTIGKYQVESELGRGGFGRVYKAFESTVQGLVPIKLLTTPENHDLVTTCPGQRPRAIHGGRCRFPVRHIRIRRGLLRIAFRKASLPSSRPS